MAVLLCFTMVLAQLLPLAALAEGTHTTRSEEMPAKAFYTVTFAAPGEDGALSEVSELFVEAGAAVEAFPAAPEKEGCAFIGWTVDEEKVELPYTPTDDVTLVAAYEALETTVYHIVRFIAEGVIVDAEQVADGETLQSLPSAPAKTGSRFLGWYEGGTPLSLGTAVTGDIEAYAVYTEVSGSLEAQKAKADFTYTDSGAYADVTIFGTHKKNQKPSAGRNGAVSGANVLEAWTANNIKNNTRLTLEAVITAVPDSGTLSAWTVIDNVIVDKVAENLQPGDRVVFELAMKGAKGIALVAENTSSAEEEDEHIVDGALYYNKDFYLSGKIPGNGVIDVRPVMVNIDGEEVLAAYDIKIYANEKQRQKGKTWQPAGKKVQVHWFSDTFTDEVNIYHIDGAAPEYVDTVEAADGWVSFEAESFSAYAVTRTIEKTVEIGGATYKITVTYDRFAGIPDGAEIEAHEAAVDEEYLARLSETAETLGVELSSITYSKLLDISIVKDGEKIEPLTPVDVKVELLDAESVTDLRVVHFGEKTEELAAQTEESTVTFETDGFSLFSLTDFSLTDRIFNAIFGDRKLYENDDIILSGKMPMLGSVEATPVQVEMEGLNVLVAYDIKIYANPLMRLLGITWQPKGDHVHVTVKSQALEVDAADVYHMENVRSEAELVSEEITVEDHSVSFDAAAFSVYVITETKLNKTVTTGDGLTYDIQVTYRRDAGIPMEGTELLVTEIKAGEAGYDEYVAASAESIGTLAKGIAFARAFDIKIVSAQDHSLVYEPRGNVKVSITLIGTELNEYPNVGVVHFVEDEGASEPVTYGIEPSVDGEEVSFVTDSFSVYVVAGYTMEKLIEASDGNTYKVSLTFTEDALLPDDAQLSVVEMTGDTLADYLARLASSMEASGFEYGRVFDISIVDGEGNEIQPGAPVQVSVALLDTEGSDDPFSVAHFAMDEEGEGEVLETVAAETEGNVVHFTAEHFSAYAIVAGPVAGTLGWKKLSSIDELIEAGSDGVYIAHPDGYYYSNTLTSDSSRTGITKTKPAVTTPEGTTSQVKAKYYFEQVEGTSNQFYVYCYATDGTTRQYVYNGGNNSLSFTTEENRTAFTLTSIGNSIFRLNNGAWYWNMQGNAAGKRFCSYNNANDGNNSIVFWVYENTDSDPYELGGKSFGLMNWNGEVSGRAMMASSATSGALDAKSLIVLSKSDNSEQLFVPNDSDISMWEFEWLNNDNYRLKTVVDGSVRYLSVSAQGLSLKATPDDTCAIQVIPGAGNHAGQICLKAGGTTLCYSGALADGFTVGGTAGSEWLNLVDLSELTSDYFMTYTASKVSVSDPAVTNGSHVIVYTRTWNDDTKKYEFYAVDSDGSLVRCFENGDTIQWVGGLLNTMLWDFVEYYWEGTNDPNYYYELFNEYSEQYIAPQVTGGQILSSEPIGINMNGRQQGYYYSRIFAWDESYYAYTGLKADLAEGKVVSCPLSETGDFYFAIVQDLPVDDVLSTVGTIDHTRYGITMKIKDFATRKEMSDFLGSDAGGAVSTTVSGLLSTDLDQNGYPTASGGSLGTLFSGAQEVNHLFIESTYSASGYYEFDSTQNFASLHGSNFVVYQQLGTNDSSNRNTLKHGQFLPFNDIEAGRFAAVNRQNLYSATAVLLPDSDPRKYEQMYLVTGDTNYYYGVELEASFTQTANGLDHWGHDIIYEFTGDDDFWLYVDGELIIDLGGIHSALPGTVNFSTGAVNVNGKHTTLRALFEANYRKRNPGATNDEVNAYLDEHFKDGGTIFKDYTTHTMRIFYMERGAGAANLHMRFNLASVSPGTVELSKELDGIEKDVSVLAEFPYQIWYSLPDEPLENAQLLVPGELASVKYKDTVNDVTYHESLTIAGTAEGTEKTYEHVYMLKPGETAVVTLPDSGATYWIVECGVNPDVYSQVTVNGTAITGTDEDNDGRKDYAITPTTSKSRPTVKYVNTVNPDSLRTLNITKQLYREDGETELHYSDDDTTFSLRLYLGDEFGSAPDSANMYSYRIKDRQGYYCTWNSENQHLVSTSWTSVEGLTAEEKQSITFSTSIYGSVAKIPAFYTVEVPNMLAGTTFRVQERPTEVPDGYSFQKYIYNETTTSTDAMTGVQDVIRSGQDPQVDVCNLRGWGLRINKLWSDADFMDSREPTYFAVFVARQVGDTDEEQLTLVSSNDVQDDQGNPTKIVRQLKYGEKTLYWYFPQLPVTDTRLADYVIREVVLTNPTVDANGNVTSYDGLTVKKEGDELTLTGKQKSESTDGQFTYIVKYETGKVENDSQVRVDTAGNNRPGVKLIKTDWAGTPLADSTFTLTDSAGNLLGTFVSGEDGAITTAFLSNDGANYTLTETEAKDGYQGLPSAITLSQNAGTVTVSGVDEAWYVLEQRPGEETTLTIKNRLFTLRAIKMDGDRQVPMSNVTFALHRQVTVGGVTSFDTTPMAGYENLKTDANGLIPKIDESLPVGTYQLREKTTLTGFQLLPSYIHFTISPTGVITLGAHPQEAVLTEATNSENDAVDYTLTVENRSRALLTVVKQVSGGFGDRNKPFEFTVTVPGVRNGEKVNVYVGDVIDPEKALTVQDGKVSFTLRHSESITLGVPMNQQITATEDIGMYTTSWKLNSAAEVRGDHTTFTLTGAATLAVENRLEAVAPTDYSSNVLPYLMLMAAGALMLVLAVRRRGGGTNG